MQPCMIQRQHNSKERCCNVMIKGTIEMHELIMPDFTLLWHFSSHSVPTYTALVILIVLSSCLFLKGISESLQIKAAKRNNHFMREDSDEGIIFPWLWRKVMFRRDVWKTMHILHFFCLLGRTKGARAREFIKHISTASQAFSLSRTENRAIQEII